MLLPGATAAPGIFSSGIQWDGGTDYRTPGPGSLPPHCRDAPRGVSGAETMVWSATEPPRDLGDYEADDTAPETPHGAFQTPSQDPALRERPTIRFLLC